MSSLAWIHLNSLDKQSGLSDTSPSKKRKKTEESANLVESSKTSGIAIALGLEDGAIQIFSLSHGRVIRTLSHRSSTSPILASTIGVRDGLSHLLWTSGRDGAIRTWDLQKNELIMTSQGDGKTPSSALSIRPESEDINSAQLLAGSNSMQLLSSSGSELKEICAFTGHASPVTSIQWDKLSTPSRRFYSSAEDDRFVYIWETPSSGTGKGKMVASFPLDANAREISTSISSGRSVLLALSSSGKIAIAPVPSELVSTAPKSKQQIPTLLPRTTISLLSKKSSSSERIISASFLDNGVRVARLSGGTKLTFETAVSLFHGCSLAERN